MELLGQEVGDLLGFHGERFYREKMKGVLEEKGNGRYEESKKGGRRNGEDKVMEELRMQ